MMIRRPFSSSRVSTPESFASASETALVTSAGDSALSTTSSRGANCTPILTSTVVLLDARFTGLAGTDPPFRRLSDVGEGPGLGGRVAALQGETGDAAPGQGGQQVLGVLARHLAATGEPEPGTGLGDPTETRGEQL